MEDILIWVVIDPGRSDLGLVRIDPRGCNMHEEVWVSNGSKSGKMAPTTDAFAGAGEVPDLGLGV